MAKSTLVNFRGKEELLAQFQQLRANRMQVAQEMVMGGGLEILSLAQMKVPYVTGTLRRSLTIELDIIGSIVLARIGTNLEYARRVEFGFSGSDSLGRKYAQAAKPYLRPAFDEGQAPALRVMQSILKKALAL